MNMESAKNAGWVPDDIPPFISGVAFLVGLRFVIFRGGGGSGKNAERSSHIFLGCVGAMARISFDIAIKSSHYKQTIHLDIAIIISYEIRPTPYCTMGCRNKDAGNIHLINKKPELFRVYRGTILHSHTGIPMKQPVY